MASEHPVWVNGHKFPNVCVARMMVNGGGKFAKDFTRCIHTGQLFKNKFRISYREPKYISDDCGNCQPYGLLLAPGYCVQYFGHYHG